MTAKQKAMENKTTTATEQEDRDEQFLERWNKLEDDLRTGEAGSKIEDGIWTLKEYHEYTPDEIFGKAETEAQTAQPAYESNDC